MRRSDRIDFTDGGIVHKLIVFAVPIVIGELFQNLYNSIDSLIVGNYVGKTALAGVGICEQPTSLIVGFFTGMSAGASALVSHSLGSRDSKRVWTMMRVVFAFSFLIGAAMCFLGELSCVPILRLTGPSEAVYAEAHAYLRIYFIGLFCTAVYSIGAGLLRALGDSKTPLLILIITCVSNILLDLLFVGTFSWGVRGAAFATIFAQSLSVVLVYGKLKKTSCEFRLSFRELAENRSYLKSVILTGFPAGIQNSLISISNLFVWRYVNLFSDSVVAGVTIAQKLDKFIALPCKAFGLTVTTFVGQNSGAKQHRRCREGMRKALILSLCVSTVLGSLLYAGAGWTASLFSGDGAVIQTAADMLHAIALLYFTMSLREILLGGMRGYGDTRVPMVLSLVGMIGIRQLYLALSFRGMQTIEPVFYCYPIAWGATALLLLVYYLLRRKSYSVREQCI